jgi:hypothetical protein
MLVESVRKDIRLFQDLESGIVFGTVISGYDSFEIARALA